MALAQCSVRHSASGVPPIPAPAAGPAVLLLRQARLSSEPPIAGAPLISEPPLGDQPPLTSEPAFLGGPYGH
ncbi:hypothetical protein LG634_33760 [Streptomyces bambusae]|uniref:hypothetical protein n=1 Tax=Streptomyces bambusae TaxID=1550616 RepID=UPI001CFF7AC2|nr:hypothetical protein [Streptomyces bambusae]MCB5169754.1 hypothetical protein [Streptomyces bambusae]